MLFIIALLSFNVFRIYSNSPSFVPDICNLFISLSSFTLFFLIGLTKGENLDY